MSEHYDKVKRGLGLDEALAPSSEDEKDDYICKFIDHLIVLTLFVFSETEKQMAMKKQFRKEMKQKKQALRDIMMKKRVDPIYEPKAGGTDSPIAAQQYATSYSRKQFASRERRHQKQESGTGAVTYGLGLTRDHFGRHTSANTSMSKI